MAVIFFRRWVLGRLLGRGIILFWELIRRISPSQVNSFIQYRLSKLSSTFFLVLPLTSVFSLIISMKEHIRFTYTVTNSGPWRLEAASTIRALPSIQRPFIEIRFPFVCSDLGGYYLVEAYGFTLISFVADNPGAWAFHCHVSWHMEAGLLMTFLSSAERIPAMVANAPAEWSAMCHSP